MRNPSPCYASLHLAKLAYSLDPSPLGIRTAIYQVNRAIHHANKERVSREAKAAIFRLLNKLRSKLRNLKQESV